MAAKIDYIIPSSNFELIRDRIGIILFEELENQSILHGSEEEPDPDFLVSIFTERFTPVDKSEGNVVILNIASIPFENQTAISQVAKASFFIDVFCDGEEGENDGYNSSSLRLQKICAAIRHILQSPHYVMLGFDPGKIQRRSVSSIRFAFPQNEHDAMSFRMGRISFDVDIYESQRLIDALPASGYDTTVRLEETELGYQFIKNN